MKKSMRFWFFRIAAILFVVMLIYRCDLLFPPDMDDSANTIKDIDGNEYTTVTIGTQEWMVENLKTTRFNDGTSITLRTDLPTPPPPTNYEAYCWYNDDISYKKPYGALYSWGAVKSAKLAPAGWHTADFSDWRLLIDFLGENIGCKLMETGSAHWIGQANDCATNESGFTALPAGYISNHFGFDEMGTGAGWWSSTMPNYPIAYPTAFVLSGKFLHAVEPTSVQYFSVRCIKNTVPTVTTAAVADITTSGAFSGGKVTIKGGSEIAFLGVCWDTSHNPTTSDSKTTDEFYIEPYSGGWKPGTFNSTITGLQPNTTYYLRAYATNSDGTGYGNEVTFKTLP